MKNICRRLFIGTVIFATALPVFAAKEKTEEQLIADLDSPKDKIVYAALQDLEKQYPTSVPALTKIKALLGDTRPIVRQKAARVLGALHVEITDTELKKIAALLDSTDKKEIMEGLKALRGLKSQSCVPKMVQLLKHADANVKRDACRTLAVIADKGVIKDIEPLLQDHDKGVVKDANDAIFKLNNK